MQSLAKQFIPLNISYNNAIDVIYPHKEATKPVLWWNKTKIINFSLQTPCVEDGGGRIFLWVLKEQEAGLKLKIENQKLQNTIKWGGRNIHKYNQNKAQSCVKLA